MPRHIAIVMDGNGRWAKEQGQDRLFGHFHGVESVRNIVEGCARIWRSIFNPLCFSYRKLGQPEDEVMG